MPGFDSGLLEPLADRWNIDVRSHVVAKHAVVVRVEAGHQCRPRRTAHRRTRVAAVKTHAVAGQPVDVRCPQRKLGPVTAHDICTLGVHEKKNRLTAAGCAAHGKDSPLPTAGVSLEKQ